jgi:hypothetical protein
VNPHDEARPLPVRRGFAVQPHAAADVAPGQWMGRVAQVVPGRAAHFHHVAGLVAFIARVLASPDTTPSEEASVVPAAAGRAKEDVESLSPKLR